MVVFRIPLTQEWPTFWTILLSLKTQKLFLHMKGKENKLVDIFI